VPSADHSGEGFSPVLLFGEEAVSSHSEEGLQHCREIPPAPIIYSVEVVPAVPDGVPINVVATLGGTVVRVTGINFLDPIIVEVLHAGAVVGSLYLFDAKYDLALTTLYMGTPPLSTGVYSLRATSVYGVGAALPNAIEARLFAHEMKAQEARSGFSPVWKTGSRFLSGGV
jgi:hypothetical protein